MSDPLTRFSRPTREWFAATFDGPTPAQAQTWAAVSADQHALVVAPTGSGKTLAAFLWAIDGLLGEEPPEDPIKRCRILYVSPLKALAADVERNLDLPLAGIRQTAETLSVSTHKVTVAVRTGDTPPAQRRAFGRRPADILITTPESLYLVLTSAARSGLTGVKTVIVDEIHALAGTKRGAHLAVSLERLDALLDDAGTGPAQRIGLSATVRPVEEVARFLTGSRQPHDGGREVLVVAPPSTKQIEIRVSVPVPDLTDLGTGHEDPERHASIWPHVHDQVVDLIADHRSTLVFTNSRRAAERLTSRINEEWTTRHGDVLPHPGELRPAQGQSSSGASVGVMTDNPGLIAARTHHGSMSRAQRTRTEEELKAGLLPAVVATSSLELGIDMGAIDLMIQVGAPPSVASGLQRIGRAGHQVGAVSRGVVLPTFRGELISSAVIADRIRAGQIEETRVLRHPLDVLAQQIVAMVGVEPWHVDDLATVIRRAAPYTELGEATLEAVLDMLAGRYPAEDFAELRPRLVWDRTQDLLTPRPGAASLAVTNGGTIPDRGLFGVFLVGDNPAILADTERVGGRIRGGRRVGELDEEMVFESRVGDTFTLGSSTWRIDQITADRVLVTPAPGAPGRLPFWKGDSPARPAELGQAIGAWLRRLRSLDSENAAAELASASLDPWAVSNLLAYLAEQHEATGTVPTDEDLLVETFRDELGDWRVVLHSPYGAQVHAPWALVLAARLQEKYGIDPAVMHSDDGIVLRLPDIDAPSIDLDDLLIEPHEVLELVRHELTGSALFAARFREAASRALLLPRRRPDRRQPLWQQRHRAGQLLQIAANHPTFPIVLEAVRECLQDDFDTQALTRLMRDIRSRRVRIHQVVTARPSPFAQSLLFGYTAQFLYDGDAPLAERRSAALTLDPTLLSELLRTDEGNLADLLVPSAIVEVESQISGTAPERRGKSLEHLADVLRRYGPLTYPEILNRVADPDQTEDWLERLEASRRIIRIFHGDISMWASVEDAGRLRDALGVTLPDLPDAFLDPVLDPWADLIRRHARAHGPFTSTAVADRYGVETGFIEDVVGRLERSGHLIRGTLRPAELGGIGDEVCDPDVLRLLRRRSLAVLRAEVESVPIQTLGVFLPRWQGVGRLHGTGGLFQAIEQLTGSVFPASVLDAVLSARVTDYSPSMTDELIATGEVLWCGHSRYGRADTLISLHPSSSADLTVPTPGPVPDSDVHQGILDVMAGGGSWLVTEILERLGGTQASISEVVDALWDLVWISRATNDRWSTLRAADAAPTRPSARLSLRTLRRPIPARGLGRWSLLPDLVADTTARIHAKAVTLLDRYGVVSGAIAHSEGLSGTEYIAIRRVLSALEESGQVRRGYFIEHLGGTQFALPGAVDTLRDSTRIAALTVIAATDPANPYGAAVPWPIVESARPSRRGEASVILADGRLIAFVDPGSGSLATFTIDPASLVSVSTGMSVLAQNRGGLTLRKINGGSVPGPGSSDPMAIELRRIGFAMTPSGIRSPHAN